MARKCPSMRMLSRSWNKMGSKQKAKYNRKARGKKTGWNMYVAEKRSNCKIK